MKHWALAGPVILALAWWMLEHPYEGLIHDSLLYTFAALARLHPESLSHDLFLAQGSQDQYTLFSPIAAWAIRTLGLERGAALVTLVGQIAFYSCGWLLARCLMPARLAVLAVGLLVTLPSEYGGLHLFSYSEMFMTPRVPAEALVLAAVAATLSGRSWLAAACLLLSACLHPLMALPGLALLTVLVWGLRRRAWMAASAAGGFTLLVLVAYLTPFGRFARFDAAWFDLLHLRFAYLFPSRWPPADLAHLCVPLITLLIGIWVTGEHRLRAVCCSALITGAGGLALAVLGTDLLHIVVITQIQPWRWLWLANTMSVILLAPIAANCWAAGYGGRAAALLLAAAWVCIDERFAPVIGLLALTAVAAAPRLKDASQGRLVLFGAGAVLFLGLLVLTGTVISIVRKLPLIPPDTGLYDSAFLLVLRQLRPWASGGVWPACLLGIGWWVATQWSSRAAAGAVVALALAALIGVAPLTWSSWTHVAIPPTAPADFAPWRKEIPAQDSVLWPGKPLWPWYLLERPSYWSNAQMAGAVYSRATAMELVRRESLLANQPAGRDAAEEMATMCRSDPALGFLVSDEDLGPTPFPVITHHSAQPRVPLRLYRCADYRS